MKNGLGGGEFISHITPLPPFWYYCRLAAVCFNPPIHILYTHSVAIFVTVVFLLFS